MAVGELLREVPSEVFCKDANPTGTNDGGITWSGAFGMRETLSVDLAAYRAGVSISYDFPKLAEQRSLPVEALDRVRIIIAADSDEQLKAFLEIYQGSTKGSSKP